MTSPGDSELDELLSLLREGLLTVEQQQRLTEMLKSDDAALRQYILATALHADLRGRLVRGLRPEGMDSGDAGAAAWGDAETDLAAAEYEPQETLYGMTIALPDDIDEPEPLNVPASFQAPQPHGLIAWLGRNRKAVVSVAAALLLAVTLVAVLLRDAPQVAILSNSANAAWEPSSESPERGQSLRTGAAFALAAGSIELTYPTGVRVNISGPAQFSLASASRLDLKAGRLSAVVPPAGKGFTVRTTVVDVVDLGTEFEIDVQATRQVAIRVAAGQVEARPPPEGERTFDAVRIAAGESALADNAGVRINPGVPVYAAASPKRVTGGPSFPSEDIENQPARVLNGNRQSWWAGDPAKDAWDLVFDFGSEVGIPMAKVDYFSRRYMARQATVLASSDGDTWHPVGDLPATNPAIMKVNRPARYLKISFAGKVADRQPAVWSVTFPSVAEVAAAAPIQEPKPGSVKGWPAVVTEVRYTSSGDNSEQPALFYDPKPASPAPLLVALHTWSSDYKSPEPDYARWCIDRGWVMVRPSFRGPNNRPEACGSDLAVADILSAVDYAKRTTKIDESRIYLIGASGGGHMALLMAGRAPEVWAGVSAWVPIYDLAAWHQQTAKANRPYWKMLEAVCGGAPGASAAVDAEYARRSPATYMSRAKVPLDINTGIHDGHTGSVPVTHALNAFNALAKEGERIPDAHIATMAINRKVPEGQAAATPDELYERAPVLYRKTSGDARITVFDGGHEIVVEAALGWLEQQQKGSPALWNLKRSAIFQPSEKAEAGR